MRHSLEKLDELDGMSDLDIDEQIDCAVPSGVNLLGVCAFSILKLRDDLVEASNPFFDESRLFELSPIEQAYRAARVTDSSVEESKASVQRHLNAMLDIFRQVVDWLVMSAYPAGPKLWVNALVSCQQVQYSDVVHLTELNARVMSRVGKLPRSTC